MRTAIAFLFTLLAATEANAHGYRIGDIEIVHPAIVAPQPGADCTCAHVKIVNHGKETEYFLGADIAVAHGTRLFHFAAHGRGVSQPAAVPILPGATLDLHRHEWCLYLAHVPRDLEPDVGAYGARLFFRRAGAIDIEFLVDPAHH